MTRGPASDPDPLLERDAAFAFTAFLGANAMRRVGHRSTVSDGLAEWAEAFLRSECAVGGRRDPLAYRLNGRRTLSEAAWKRCLRALERAADGTAHGFPRTFAQSFGLSLLDVQILTIVALYCTHPRTEHLLDQLLTRRSGTPQLALDPVVFSLLLGCPSDHIRQALLATAPLRTTGLLVSNPHGDAQVPFRILRLRDMPGLDGAAMQEAILGTPRAASLALEAFDHLREDVARVRKLLAGALEQRAEGVHVLLHGPPGTGKTELCGSLAAALGVPCFPVGEADAFGNEPTRAERLAELRIAQSLLRHAPPALLLLDEAEDVLFGDFGAEVSDPTARGVGGSRAFLHRLLETTRVPVIWTANSLRRMGPAVLRRMSAIVEMPVPSTRVRARLLRDAAAAEGLTLTAGGESELAREVPAAPALLRSALRAARLAGGEPESVRWALQGVMRAMNDGVLPRAELPPPEFDPALLNADLDLAALTARLAAPDAPREVSLLLSGPPGSGKSAYARYLAEAMGLPVTIKRASDLLGPYVGQTEHNIAQAFEAARREGSFLIFDEADSLLGGREGATRPWEVSQVNEMLTWMERHPMPFCCTTNLPERLDPAAQRRFVLKVRFDALGPVQLLLAFERLLGQPPPPGTASLEGLTPADFALVRRAAAIHRKLDDPSAMLAMLAREAEAKGARRKVVGFRV
jgi:SpoVK/Ycf46/Vps4 family AAA+-type ATPase